ncbi:MAG: 2-oxoacid:acceptor oxidoreductase family protein [Candidatus Omnitrophota bacterium]|nr:2-oxoacid:acceptor oxidoreductase family protein [Candidatus Omnitrophota bacterium]
MNDFSILIGGKAGDGIDKAGTLIARILNTVGYRIYIYRNYPSIIRGGHAFSIIRAAKNKISTHLNKVDFLLALNQDSLDLHYQRVKDDTIIIYNSDAVTIAHAISAKTFGIPLEKIIKEENTSQVMRNSCLVGAFCKSTGIKWDILEKVFRKVIGKEIELNLKVALRGYNETKEIVAIEALSQKSLPLITGNEAIGLGFIKAGLKAYIAYPMTPSSPILIKNGPHAEYLMKDSREEFFREIREWFEATL